MSLVTHWAVRCSFEGCREALYGLAATPTEFSLLAEDEGWTFPPGEYAAVYTPLGRAHCPRHRLDVEWGEDWTDDKARYEASCATCGDAYVGSEDSCREWAEDHECEPDTAVRRVPTPT